jgi:nicotinamide-nucleotide amidase
VREKVSAAELDYVTIDTALIQRGVESLTQAKLAGLRIVTAESCTGGLIALVLSEAPGAAEYLEGGFVVYTPTQKCVALELDPTLIDKHGAVSAEVAKAMALGALANSAADIALSVTGVAGPDPDEQGNPVGVVYFACVRQNGPFENVKRQFGNIGRSRIRYESACEGLRLIKKAAAL